MDEGRLGWSPVIRQGIPQPFMRPISALHGNNGSVPSATFSFFFARWWRAVESGGE